MISRTFWPFRTRAARPEGQTRPSVGVRMEAVGGQGANSAGKILAEAAVLGMGHSGNHFSTYGSEKRGSPVRSHVRFAPDHRAVRSAAPVGRPDVLVVFHEALLGGRPESLAGADEGTDLVVNSPLSPEEIRVPVGLRLRRIITVDATKIARKQGCGINSVLLGAILPLVPEITQEALTRAFRRFFAKLPAEKLEANVKALELGARKCATARFEPHQATLEIRVSSLPRMGWENAPIGGLISNPGNTVLRDNSTSRSGTVPRFLPDLCVNCGFCDMVCPDYCMVWQKPTTAGEVPKLLGVDYQY